MNETSDETKARRLAKRAAKQARREEPVLAGYSDASNPWQDPNLSEHFVWGKKHRDSALGRQESDTSRRRELADELSRVKKAREDRERERTEWEDEKRNIDRQREQMSFAESERRDDDFQFQQEQSRALKRIEEGRARPMDLLVVNLNLLQADNAPSEQTLHVEIVVFDCMAIFTLSSSQAFRQLSGSSQIVQSSQ